MMEETVISNLPPGTKAALHAQGARHHLSAESEARRILMEALSRPLPTIVDALAMRDERAGEIDFEPRRLNLGPRC
jgi:antitoxin FitA